MLDKKYVKSVTMPIAITKNEEPNAIRVIVNANPNMVVGRNVALIDKGSKRIFGYGKVTNRNIDKAFVDVITFGGMVKDGKSGSRIVRVISKPRNRKRPYRFSKRPASPQISKEADLLKSTEIVTID